MKIKFLFIVILIFCGFPALTQDAEKILSRYYEKEGGLQVWKDMKTMRMKASFEQGDMKLGAIIFRKQPDFFPFLAKPLM